MSTEVVVTGLRLDTTAQALEPLFLNCGPIVSITIHARDSEGNITSYDHSGLVQSFSSSAVTAVASTSAPPTSSSAENEQSSPLSATIVYKHEDGAIVASMLDGCLLEGTRLGVHSKAPTSFSHTESAKATGTEGINIITSKNSGRRSPPLIVEVAKKGASVVVGGASVVAGGVKSGAGAIVGGVAGIVKGKEVTGATTQQYGGGFQPQWGAAPQ